MIEAGLYPSSLPYGMLITHILEANSIPLTDIVLIPIKQCYNSIAFVSMGYILTKGSLVLKLDVGPSSPKYKSPPPPDHALSVPVNKVLTQLTDVDIQLATLKDIIIGL